MRKMYNFRRRIWGMQMIKHSIFFCATALLAGCHDHCLMCHEDKAQRRACQLRRALDMIPNDTTDREDGDCPYYILL